MNRIMFLLIITRLCSHVWSDDFAAKREYNWHQWRGPSGGGVAGHGDPPVHWDSHTNIKWKVPIPGEGSATPIVWQQRIFLVTAIKTDRVAKDPPQADERAKTRPPQNYYQFAVICLDRATGKKQWQKVACEDVPHEGRHPTNTFASASPVTDGQRLYVSFGSRGVFCFDLEGNELWHRDLGKMRTRYGWGEAASPAVHGDSVVINWDHEDQSFITVLNAKTGETRWKKDRDEPTSWATPLVVKYKGRVQTIVNGTNRVRSYDLATGDVIWECGGQTVNAIPSPVTSGDLVVCMSGYRGSLAVAVPLASHGDLTVTQRLVWSYRQGTPYVPSPIIYGDQLYFTRGNTAVLSCLDLSTGEPIFSQQRLPGLFNMYASPVAVAGRIYFVDRDGTTMVIKHGRKLEVLATNKLDEPIDASPAIVGNQLFLRGAGHVYCIGENH